MKTINQSSLTLLIRVLIMGYYDFTCQYFPPVTNHSYLLFQKYDFLYGYKLGDTIKIEFYFVTEPKDRSVKIQYNEPLYV